MNGCARVAPALRIWKMTAPRKGRAISDRNFLSSTKVEIQSLPSLNVAVEQAIVDSKSLVAMVFLWPYWSNGQIQPKKSIPKTPLPGSSTCTGKELSLEACNLKFEKISERIKATPLTAATAACSAGRAIPIGLPSCWAKAQSV